MIQEKFEVYIPSWKRAKALTTRKLFPEAIIAVDHSEADEYREIWGEPIMVCPEGVQGNLCRVRNYCLDQAGTDCVLILDDDYVEVGYYQGKVEHRLTGADLLGFVQNGFTMAQEIGTGLWGLQVQKDPKFYREYSPFSLLAPILGPWQAVVRSELRYDESLYLKEDYDFFIQHVRKFHKCLRFNKYWYQVAHINNSGGQQQFRNFQREVKQNQALQKKWGRRIVRFHETRRKASLNPVVKVPFKGI